MRRFFLYASLVAALVALWVYLSSGHAIENSNTPSVVPSAAPDRAQLKMDARAVEAAVAAKRVPLCAKLVAYDKRGEVVRAAKAHAVDNSMVLSTVTCVPDEAGELSFVGKRSGMSVALVAPGFVPRFTTVPPLGETKSVVLEESSLQRIVVRTVDGAPVEGFRVLVYANAAASADCAEGAKSKLVYFNDTRSLGAVAVTNVDGIATLEHLPRGNYLVEPIVDGTDFFVHDISHFGELVIPSPPTQIRLVEVCAFAIMRQPHIVAVLPDKRDPGHPFRGPAATVQMLSVMSARARLRARFPGAMTYAHACKAGRGGHVVVRYLLADGSLASESVPIARASELRSAWVPQVTARSSSRALVKVLIEGGPPDRELRDGPRVNIRYYIGKHRFTIRAHHGATVPVALGQVWVSLGASVLVDTFSPFQVTIDEARSEIRVPVDALYRYELRVRLPGGKAPLYSALHVSTRRRGQKVSSSRSIVGGSFTFWSEKPRESFKIAAYHCKKTAFEAGGVDIRAAKQSATTCALLPVDK